MIFRFAASLLVGCYLIVGSSPVLAQDGSRLLTPAEKKVYHACLYASFINSYCRYNAWGPSAAAFQECVIANRVKRVRLAYPYWHWGVEGSCRALAQARGY